MESFICAIGFLKDNNISLFCLLWKQISNWLPLLTHRTVSCGTHLLRMFWSSSSQSFHWILLGLSAISQRFSSLCERIPFSQVLQLLTYQDCRSVSRNWSRDTTLSFRKYKNDRQASISLVRQVTLEWLSCTACRSRPMWTLEPSRWALLLWQYRDIQRWILCSLHSTLSKTGLQML